MAGGASTRFPGDKLDPSTGLLNELFGGISSRFLRVLVGRAPAAGTNWPDLVIPDDFPGGGPAAAIITGLQLLRSIVMDVPAIILPGDSPGGFGAIEPLLCAVTGSAGNAALAACARDETGRIAPMPSALSAAGRVRLLDGVGGRAGSSVRELLRPLAPAGVLLPQRALFDVDTAADLAGWRLREQPSARELRALILALRGQPSTRAGHRLTVALHGPPPATAALAAAVRTAVAVTVHTADGGGAGHRKNRGRVHAQAEAAGRAATSPPEVVLRLVPAGLEPGAVHADAQVLVRAGPPEPAAPEPGWDLALGWPE